MRVVRFVTIVRVFLSLAALTLAASARAQTPEGPHLPPPDGRLGAVHGQVRLGYYLSTHTYRSHGTYDVGVNFARLAGSTLYGFSDVDVEAYQDSSHGSFKPERLVGTFEVGVRGLFGAKPLFLLLRHQSAHYIDRDDLRQGNWDMVGLRWQRAVRRTLLTATLARYVHVYQLASDYRHDLDVQGVSPLGAFRRHPLELRADVHAATGDGGKGGYTDFWVEPGISLSPQVIAFVGYGQIHDTNLSAASTDHPTITGVRFVF